MPFGDRNLRGLGVCVGPSPAMVNVVERHQVGVVSPSFEPRDVASALNRLTLDDIRAMRAAARRAARTLNADVEMGKVVELYNGLFSTSLVAQGA